MNAGNEEEWDARKDSGLWRRRGVLPQHWLGTGTTTSTQCAAGDGEYCGGNGVTGDASTLFSCAGGKATALRKCTNGCVAELPGTDDYCASTKPCASGDGFYCGGNGVPGWKGTLYRCTGGRARAERECPYGCASMAAGTDDYCW